MMLDLRTARRPTPLLAAHHRQRWYTSTSTAGEEGAGAGRVFSTQWVDSNGHRVWLSRSHQISSEEVSEQREWVSSKRDVTRHPTKLVGIRRQARRSIVGPFHY